MCITFGNPSDPCCEDASASPLLGNISRFVYPEPIADDTGLSDASWQSGVTGNINPDHNRTCLYHHFTTPDKKNTSVFNILQPLRWSIETPADDGASWDHWSDMSVGAEGSAYRYGQLTDAGGARTGLRDKLLPRDWHCRFWSNLVRMKSTPRPYFCNRDFDVLDIGGGEGYAERSLQSIAPSTPPWEIDGSSDTYPCSVSPYAVRHVVNGVPGTVYLIDDLSDTDEYPLVRVTAADTYQMDVWYRIGNAAAENFSASPGKGCCYFPLRRVSNGSRGALNCSYLLSFHNVDFSPRYNPEQHTYAITVAGHVGWTLRDGSNGPHALVPEDGWLAGNGPVTAGVQTADATSFWATIQLNFGIEIPHILFAPGAAMRAKYPTIGRAIMYRPIDNPGLYRRFTVSADFGNVTHAQSGRFYQDGTTVFELVPWTVEGGEATEPSPYVSLLSQRAGGRMDSAASPPAYREVPRRIIVSRISR